MKSNATSRLDKLHLPSRLGKSNEEVLTTFKHLSRLIGVWSGNKGVNLAAVPDQKGGFTLLLAPYYETLTVTPLSSPTPNKGLKEIELLPTLMYSLTRQNAIDNSLIHIENGIWEEFDRPEDNDGFHIVRIASFPKGSTIVALGSTLKTDGKPDIDTGSSSLPIPVEGKFPEGYLKPYDSPFENMKNSQFINTYLTQYLEAQEKEGKKIASTTGLFVSTLNSGGITNIPSVDKNAKAIEFSSSFWLETVEDSIKKESFQQLQYSQKTILDFSVSASDAETIHWPQISVNTLIKQ